MSKALRIIFAGTPEFSARHLSILLSSGYQIVGVFSQPDRPAGRGRKLISSPVKLLAEKKRLPIFQPISLYSWENHQLIADLNADLMVVVAYGLILPKSILSIPRLGCINVHPSLLPRWRGAAPIQRALFEGDSETGITIIQMDAGLDTGDILYKLTCPISEKDTSATLFDKLANLGSRGLIKILQQLSEGIAIPKVQDESLVTYAKKLTKVEARIDWSLPVIQLERCIRVFNPWPMSWIMINNELIKIYEASVIHINPPAEPGTLLKTSKNGIQVAASDGILNLTLLQPAGKRVMRAQDLINSRHEWFIPGKSLSK